MIKKEVVLVFVIVAIISGSIGFIIGKSINKNNDGRLAEEKNTSTEIRAENVDIVKQFCGTYRTSSWNGKEAVIVLQKDKTMMSPNGNGVWSFDEGKIFIEYELYMQDTIDEKNGKVIHNTVHVKDEIIMVSGGLMYKDKFFEKVNK